VITDETHCVTPHGDAERAVFMRGDIIPETGIEIDTALAETCAACVGHATHASGSIARTPLPAALPGRQASGRVSAEAEMDPGAGNNAVAGIGGDP